MKKFLCAVLLIALFSSSCFAEDSSYVDAGLLTYLGTTEAEFQSGLDDLRKALAPFIPSNDDDDYFVDDMEFIGSLIRTRRIVHFYESLLSMQMALRSKKVDEIVLPDAVGQYLTSNNTDFEILYSLNMLPSTISFGFKKGNTALQSEFNKAITDMKKDGTLARLEEEYITDFSGDIEQVEFQKFDKAKTVRVAVTGDLPPIDYIAANGKPTGYNTAILSEIGKRIKKNIRLISVDAGGRAAALASERADVVFWFRNSGGIKIRNNNKNLKNVMKDSFDGIILSEPYYEWDTDLIISRSN